MYRTDKANQMCSQAETERDISLTDIVAEVGEITGV